MFQRIARMFRATPATRPPVRTVRLAVEPLDIRAVPATFAAATVAELIDHINSSNSPDYPGADTITLTPGATYTLTAADPTTNWTDGLPVVKDRLVFVGNGATIERNPAAGTPDFRLLEVAASGSLTLQNLTLQGGRAFGNGTAAVGGAVLNRGALELKGVTVQNNTAQGNTLGFLLSQYGGPAYGGGVYSSGTLSVTDSVIRNNQAVGGYGGKGYYTYYGFESTRVFVSAGPGGDGFGGGVYVADGFATFTGTTVTGNAAVAGKSGNQGASKGHGYGGGLYIAPVPTAVVTIDKYTSVARNTASTSNPDIAGTYIRTDS
jgi:hypothetical protein